MKSIIRKSMDKDCPKCLSTNIQVILKHSYWHRYCVDCGNKSIGYTLEEKAITAWDNKRDWQKRLKELKSKLELDINSNIEKLKKEFENDPWKCLEFITHGIHGRTEQKICEVEQKIKTFKKGEKIK